ncbi:DUF2062 domain-containing protein [Flavobacteriaceae bacterium F89]|uniref:DUF2062 domain-containing protein n=1 Tax=Cerina litoralis TaxID=2874477 RepID=A0AAE3ETF6_9FLAO|nr:DUF2062 domain-containing protein [Cerina litoralis]MCG2460165.1 DUF2062 domain-containing protein [Cerina litoralis]
MTRLNCCVVIPTYNNARTLKGVINGVLEYTDRVIIVNDGCTDDTANILEGYPQLEQIRLSNNTGKGIALRLGFQHAVKLGFEYAITIDSDGQHFPDDIPVFLKALEQEDNKNLLLIGARNMDHSTVPKNSSFGNKFSSFWFWVETGIRLRDTQCGYRMYPVKQLQNLKFHTKKFEFEIEAIVRASWNGTLVKNVGVKVHYDETDRVSHFRPITDFVRISILNTVLVTIAFFYIKPRDLYRKLKKKGVKRFLVEDFLHSDDSPKKKAFSIALGVFIGLTPLWGLQTVIVLFLAVLLRLNKVIAFAFSNVSFPPFIPFILYVSLVLGNWVLGQDFLLTSEDISGNFELIQHLKAYVVGSMVLSTFAALLFGMVGYIFLSIFDSKKIVIGNG